jgi:hypothetical protein
LLPVRLVGGLDRNDDPWIGNREVIGKVTAMFPLPRAVYYHDVSSKLRTFPNDVDEDTVGIAMDGESARCAIPSEDTRP